MHPFAGHGHEWWQAALLMLLFWGGVAALIAVAVRAWARPAAVATTGGPPALRPAPMEVLEDRLARGEMSVEEFAARRDALLGQPAGPEGVTAEE
jgi:hypothetical protein